MLTRLKIINYTLIDSLDIPFTDGLISITGETGAGKSILLGGISHILGKRVDLNSLKQKDTKCVIEAEFDVRAYNLQDIFENLDLDYTSQTILRREIIPSGKSRAFINDTPVTLDKLERISTCLIDIHSQHKTLSLAEESFQMEIIDALAKNSELLDSYKVELKKYKKTHSELLTLTQKITEFNKEKEYKQFLYEELVALNLEKGLKKQLEEEYNKTSNAEELKNNLSLILQTLSNEETGVQTQLLEAKNTLQRNATISSTFEGLLTRLEGVYIELDDLVSELTGELDEIEIDPIRSKDLEDKLQKINALENKHQVSESDELLEIQQALEQKIYKSTELETQVDGLEKRLTTLKEEVTSIGKKLSDNRLKAIPNFINQLKTKLGEMGMPDADLKINLTQQSEFHANGMDEISYNFCANKGGNYGAIDKVASGGELSRIMLAIKVILSKYKKLPSIIFDEIDTGVSGEISLKMGELMKNMSNDMQVFTITHLPQVAAMGKTHYKVYKTTHQENTTTHISKLNREERITEVAKMLGGDNFTASAMEHSKELLKSKLN